MVQTTLSRILERIGRTAAPFLRRDDGNVAITTGLMAVPILMAVGVGVDMGESYRAKTNFQMAIDAGALAAAKTFSRGGSPTEAQEAAKAVFLGNLATNLPDSTGTITIQSTAADCTTDGIVATATLRHELYFDGIHGAFSDSDPNHINLPGRSVVKCGAKTVEIAMALDNSGSMGWNGKLDTLKSASKDLVDTIFESMEQSPYAEPVRFSLVPFSAFVKLPDNVKNKFWMDPTGRSPIHHENFNWDEDPIALKASFDRYKHASNGNWLTRQYIYEQMNLKWAGCVETRPYPQLTTDEPPSDSKPETLFVPAFLPDTPDDWSGRTERKQAGKVRHIFCIQWDYSNRRGFRCKRWSNVHMQTNVQQRSVHACWSS